MESRITHFIKTSKELLEYLKQFTVYETVCGIFVCTFVFSSCGSEAPPMGTAIFNRDSLPAMITHGVSKLISDSGIVQYKVVTEEWRVFDRTTPKRQEFPKGIFLERYDKQFKVMMHITADTAYCYNQNLWELRGRVYVRNKENGTIFSSEELFWNMQKHWMHSNKPMHIITPDRDLQGNRFESNEQLTKYRVWQTNGFAPVPENKNQKDSTVQDSTIVVRDAPTKLQKISTKRDF